MKRIAGLVAGLFLLNAVAIGFVGMKAFADDAPSSRASGPVGTAFAYQGRLTGDGTTVSGTCDMEFTLFDDSTNGSAVASTETVSSVAVENGLFSTELDFGDTAFEDGDARWLEIGVRCPAGSGSFTMLPARQALTSTPFAQFANHAPWSGLTGVPAGLGGSYENVVIVDKSGGDFTSIQAAIDSVSANSADRYLIWIAPGTYEEKVTVPQYIDLLGAGRNLVTIASTGGTTVAGAATVTMVTQSSLRSLTVVNTGGGNVAVGVTSSSGGTIRLNDVEILANGSPNVFGIYNSTTWIEATDVKVTLNAGDSGNGVGVLLQLGGISTFHDVEVYSYAISAVGISISGNTTYLTMEGGSIITLGGVGTSVFGTQAGFLKLKNVQISANANVGGTAIGVSLVGGLTIFDGGRIEAYNGATAIGIEAYQASPVVDGMRIIAQNATTQNIGIRHFNGASPQITNTSINANGTAGRALTNTAGDGAAPATTVIIKGSSLQGNVNSVASFTGNITYKVSGSHLDGPAGATGTYVCVNSAGANFKVLTAGCAVTP